MKASNRGVAIQVGQFALVGLVALVVVGIGTTIAARRVGEREAITDARATTVARAQGKVEPGLTDALLDQDPQAVQAVADVIERSVLDDSLVRVKLWARDGTILYSDESRLNGLQFTLGDDELESLDTGAIEAEVSDLSKPENEYERPFGRLLEVYLPVYTTSGTPLLFEAYYRYDAVSASGARLWRSFAPIALGALVILVLVQLPLVWSLARRAQQRVEERERLLRRALDASDVERRRIASDLHDGVVQDLAGVAYALSAAARQAPAGSEEGVLLERSAEQVRGSITSLRSLLVDIYPPNLEREGLAAALTDLVAGTSARGLTVELDTSALVDAVPPATAQLLYRCAQEGLRNVIRHAGARSATLELARNDGEIVLTLADDGRGFDPEEAAERAASGHLGLRGLESLVQDAGGSMSVTARPEGGTMLAVKVPT